jgi:hypothetical protein
MRIYDSEINVIWLSNMEFGTQIAQVLCNADFL